MPITAWPASYPGEPGNTDEKMRDIEQAPDARPNKAHQHSYCPYFRGILLALISAHNRMHPLAAAMLVRAFVLNKPIDEFQLRTRQLCASTMAITNVRRVSRQATRRQARCAKVVAEDARASRGWVIGSRRR